MLSSSSFRDQNTLEGLELPAGSGSPPCPPSLEEAVVEARVGLLATNVIQSSLERFQKTCLHSLGFP